MRASHWCLGPASFARAPPARVTQVKYNRFHDQLVLSAGTDSVLNLWSMVSISSAPLGDLEDPTKCAAPRRRTSTQHSTPLGS